jgi:nucleotide-binding universal stress UspA family protein
MKKKIHKILACVDLSEYSSMVLEYSVELVQHAHIVVYNIINQLDVDAFEMVRRDIPGNISVEDFVKNLKKERERLIKDLIKQHFFEHKSRMSFMIDVGVPSIQILKTVDRENIDLIVMANKGKGNIERVLFGSAAEKVFRHSPVPVVSIRDRKIFKREK